MRFWPPLHHGNAGTARSRRESADEAFEDGGPSERPAVLVGHGPVDVALEEGEHGEPDARAAALLVGSSVGQRVVVQEESGGDVEGDEDVDGVMLVRRQDEEDAEQVEDPRERVDEVPAARRVCGRTGGSNMIPETKTIVMNVCV